MRKTVTDNTSGTTATGGANGQRIIGLDLFRISLALLIFLFHSHIHVLRCDYGWLNGFVDMGAIAMTGFFLLSGYALNLAYGKKNLSDGREMKLFYAKRLIAILPLYYAWATVNVAVNIMENGTAAAIQELMLFPVETLGIQSVYSSLFEFSHNGGSWFISCILFCYFLYPLFNTQTRLMNNRQKTAIIIIFAAILLWSPFVQHFFKLQTIYSNPFFRVLEFSIGVLVSQINTDNGADCRLRRLLRSRFACAASVACLVVGVSVAYYIGMPYDYMLFNWVALPCFVSLLFSLGSIRFARLQESKTVRYLSALAFSIFLSQLLVVWDIVKFVLENTGHNNNIAKISLSAAICFAIANIFHFCIEKPSAKYLKHRLQRHSAPPKP